MQRRIIVRKVHTLPSVKKKSNRQRKSGVSSLERKLVDVWRMGWRVLLFSSPSDLLFCILLYSALPNFTYTYYQVPKLITECCDWTNTKNFSRSLPIGRWCCHVPAKYLCYCYTIVFILDTNFLGDACATLLIFFCSIFNSKKNSPYYKPQRKFQQPGNSVHFFGWVLTL